MKSGYSNYSKKISARNLGLRGEVLASVYLQSLGYELVSANYRFSHREIDLVMRHGRFLVFVEVKTRTEGSQVPVLGAVDKKKQCFLFSAAAKYIRQYRELGDVRFDIVCIEQSLQGRLRVACHVQDAFRPFGG